MNPEHKRRTLFNEKDTYKWVYDGVGPKGASIASHGAK